MRGGAGLALSWGSLRPRAVPSQVPPANQAFSNPYEIFPPPVQGFARMRASGVCRADLSAQLGVSLKLCMARFTWSVLAIFLVGVFGAPTMRAVDDAWD